MQTRKLRILYVDDNDDTCFIVLTLLKRAGYTAVTADSIHGALWLAQRESFDLHIMEKMLPDGSGLDLCRTLRAFKRFVPVIFYADDKCLAERENALRAGAQFYVVKPHTNVLVETVHRLLSERKLTAPAA